MTNRLDIRDLASTRGDRPLFARVSATLPAGTLLHVTGSNGSGKTTLLRTLCGLTRPAAGEIRWGGATIGALGDDYRAAVAYVGHLDGVQGELTPSENLRTGGCANGVDAAMVADALERLGLTRYQHLPAKLLSQGQRRRLALARLTVVSRPLWILDEPFTALDQHSQLLATTILQEHLTSGGVAALSSHQELVLPGARIVRVNLDSETHRANARPAAAAHPASIVDHRVS